MEYQEDPVDILMGPANVLSRVAEQEELRTTRQRIKVWRKQ